MFTYCNDNPGNGRDPSGLKMWYIDTNCDGKPSEIPYYKDYELIIYYYNLSSEENLNYPAFNQGYSPKAKYVPVGSFTELVNALKSVPIGIHNIYLYLHSDPGQLAFYYNLNFDASKIEQGIPSVSISGDIFLFSCHGASIADAFSKATGRTVVATRQAVSFSSDGKARIGIGKWEELPYSIHYLKIGWYAYSSEGHFLYSRIYVN